MSSKTLSILHLAELQSVAVTHHGQEPVVRPSDVNEADSDSSCHPSDRLQSTSDFVNDEIHGIYGTMSKLQSYQAFALPSESSESLNKPKYWIVFIHGGAWRDPTIDASSFVSTCKHLISSPLYDNILQDIAGFVSLNYRLSTHPDYPQNALTVDSIALRTAKHPDHIADILAGISTLQSKFGFSDQYVLVGHSCGATMALQCVMDLPETEAGRSAWTAPRAILGIDGIYDIPALLATHENQAVYRDCIKGAFGPDEKLWTHVSPARGHWLSAASAWGKAGRNLLVLAHSEQDDLVDYKQSEIMLECIRRAWDTPGTGHDGENGQACHNCVCGSTAKSALMQLQTGHYEVWEQGWELARAISLVVRGLKRMETGHVAFKRSDNVVGVCDEAHD